MNFLIRHFRNYFLVISYKKFLNFLFSCMGNSKNVGNFLWDETFFTIIFSSFFFLFFDFPRKPYFPLLSRSQNLAIQITINARTAKIYAKKTANICQNIFRIKRFLQIQQIRTLPTIPNKRGNSGIFASNLKKVICQICVSKCKNKGRRILIKGQMKVPS